MSWNPLQREALEAMGFSPYRLASATVVESAMDVPMRTPMSRDGVVKHGASAGARIGIDAMTAALLRAAGADDGAREAVLGICPAPQALRGDAGAKRALWPRLRAMRRGWGRG